MHPGLKVAKIQDEHLGAAEAYVDGLVEAIGHKDYCVRVRGVFDEITYVPGAPLRKPLRRRGYDGCLETADQHVGMA